MKNTKNTNHRPLVWAVLSLLTASAQGALFVSNLGEVNDTSNGFCTGGSDPPPATWGGAAVSFTVGSQNYFLNHATLRLEGDTEFSDGAAEWHAFIFSNSGSEPGGVLYDLGTWSHTGGGTTLDHDFLAPGNSLLSANTSYWLVAKSDCAAWRATSSDNETGQLGWSIGDTVRLGIFPGSSHESDFTPLFAIDAAAVPEPVGSGFVGVLVCVGTAVWWRRTRCRPQNSPPV